MTLPRLAVLDVETSGLAASRHRILQAAVVQVSESAEVGAWSSYVRLRWPWQRVGPRHVHGIRRAALRGAPSLTEALDELAAQVDGALLTAHNAAFDTEFIRAASRHATPDAQRVLRHATDAALCTLELSRATDPERRRSHRLGDLCEYYGVALDQPHDALHDARATAAIVPKLLADLGIDSRAQLDPFIVGPSASDDSA
ncbi:MAG: 3'-5' exonuclease [Actinomycetota bacterium]